MKMFEPWVIFAFIALIGYFFVNFLLKFVSKENPLIISLILYGAATITMFIILAPKLDFSISTKAVLIAIAIGVFSVTATVFAIKSINLAPNPGYSVAIYSASFVLISIISIFAFGSSLTIKKFIGMLTTLIGLILLSI